MSTPDEPAIGDRAGADPVLDTKRSLGTRSVHAFDGSDIAGRGDPNSFAEEQQTLAEFDRTLSDADQTISDSDQLAFDSDQVANYRDLAPAVDQPAHGVSRDIRRRAPGRAARTARACLNCADERDAVADVRDLGGLARDLAADARDLAMMQLDAAAEHGAGTRKVTGVEIVMRAADQRRSAAQHRAWAAKQRLLASIDRRGSARDREQSAWERQQAFDDREALARQLAVGTTDPLTGARARTAGLTDLDHEVDRCRSTGGLLVIASIDVVGLEALSESESRGTGDELLKRVVALISERLRSFDLIIRMGDDQFLCAMPTMTLTEARKRFCSVAAALAAAPVAGALRCAFAEIAPGETATELVSRAESKLHDRCPGAHDSQPDLGATRASAGTSDNHLTRGRGAL